MYILWLVVCFTMLSKSLCLMALGNWSQNRIPIFYFPFNNELKCSKTLNTWWECVCPSAPVGRQSYRHDRGCKGIDQCAIDELMVGTCRYPIVDDAGTSHDHPREVQRCASCVLFGYVCRANASTNGGYTEENNLEQYRK